MDTTEVAPSPSQHTGATVAPWRLLIVRSPKHEAEGSNRFVNGDKPLVLGREGESLELDQDAQLSRFHCQVEAAGDGGFQVRDLGSTNGTWVNGKRIDTHPLEHGDVLRIGQHLLLYQELNAEHVDALIQERGEDSPIVGQSPQMALLRRRVADIGPHLASVLIFGETGTGKEVTAQALHRAFAAGATKPFVALNCSTLVETLTEADLFGHLKAAFDGAQARTGLFREADGGTLFLDEIGEMPLAVQAKFLRVLEEGTVRPLGSDRPLPARPRIVAATHKDLTKAQTEGHFRSDLYNRLRVHVVRVPPLRERRDDILPLAQAFLRQYAGGRRVELAVDAAELLLCSDWPGNVRELRTLIEAMATSGAELPAVVDAAEIRRHRDDGGVGSKPPSREILEKHRAVLELSRRPPRDKEELLRAARAFDHNVTRMAEHYTVDRKMIYKWRDKFGVASWLES
jgi:DNA-binding NtrC family response regulator